MSDITKLKDKKIVLVEDDKFLGGLVSQKLLGAGCQVTLVDKGSEAIAVIEKTLPHIVILDLLLPGMSGFDVLRGIRASNQVKNIPVIILSNLSEEKDIKQAKDLGVTEFLIKATIDMDEIVNHVADRLPKLASSMRV